MDAGTGQRDTRGLFLLGMSLEPQTFEKQAIFHGDEPRFSFFYSI